MFNEEQLNMIHHLVVNSFGRPNTERELPIKKSILKIIDNVMEPHENSNGTFSYRLIEK